MLNSRGERGGYIDFCDYGTWHSYAHYIFTMAGERGQVQASHMPAPPLAPSVCWDRRVNLSLLVNCGLFKPRSTRARGRCIAASLWLRTCLPASRDARAGVVAAECLSTVPTGGKATSRQACPAV